MRPRRREVAASVSDAGEARGQGVLVGGDGSAQEPFSAVLEVVGM